MGEVQVIDMTQNVQKLANSWWRVLLISFLFYFYLL